MPRPPPGRIRHSVRTFSRCRARAASSRSWAATESVSTRSVQPTPGSTRRERRSSPAAFCARAPDCSRWRSTGRSSRVAASCAQRTARPIWPGPSCRCPGTAGIRGAQRGGPHPFAVRRGEPGRLRLQRDLAAPRRVPADVAGEQHRQRQRREPAQGVRGRVGQGLDRFGDDPAPAQQRLPPRDADQFLRGRAGRQPTQVEPDDAVAGRRQRRRGDRGAGAPAVVAQVDQPDLIRHGATAPRGARGGRARAGSVTAPGQDPAQVVGEPARGRGDLGEDVGQRGVRVVGPQQVRGHPVRHPQAAGEERALRLLDGHEQVLQQRRPRGQPPARGGCGRPGGADLQGQPDRGPAPGDVVVEVAVEPLEPGVEVRDERGEQDLDVEVGQAAGLLQRPQPGRARRPARRPGAPRRRAAGRGCGRRGAGRRRRR